MTQDELAVMDGGKCIFMLRGVRPFLSDKYDLTQHPNYRYTADADPKNVFDMERYMKKQRAVVKPTDTFDVYEIDATTYPTLAKTMEAISKYCEENGKSYDMYHTYIL